MDELEDMLVGQQNFLFPAALDGPEDDEDEDDEEEDEEEEGEDEAAATATRRLSTLAETRS